MSHQPILQRDLKTISEKCNQDVRVSAVFELMIDGTNAQFIFEGSESRFDLRQLHIAGPEQLGISGRQVRTKQVVAVTPLGLFELGLIQTESKGFAGYGLSRVRDVDFDKTKRAAGCPVWRRRYAGAVDRAKASYGALHAVA